MKKLNVLPSLLLLSALWVVAPGCPSDQGDGQARAQDGHDHGAAAADPFAGVTAAIAVMHPTQGSQVKGVVRFTREGEAVKVVADIEGLAPNSRHGFHVHEFGDCSAPDATSAGGHYNPEGHAHAGPSDTTRHAGDFGNLEADAQGKAHLELTVQNITIAGAKNPVLGRGLIVHADPDDLKSQPTGNAGARVACGVIGVAKGAQ